MDILVTRLYRQWAAGNRKTRQPGGTAIGKADSTTDLTGPATNYGLDALPEWTDPTTSIVYEFQFWSIQGSTDKTTDSPLSSASSIAFDVNGNVTATAWYLPKGSGSGSGQSTAVSIDAFDVNLGVFSNDDFVDVTTNLIPDPSLTDIANDDGSVNTAAAETITARPALQSDPTKTFDTYRWNILLNGNSSLTPNNRALVATQNGTGVALALYFKPADCSFTLDMTPASVGNAGTAIGQTLSFNVNTTDACVWQAYIPDPITNDWYSISSLKDQFGQTIAPTGTVAGKGTVYYTVTSNPGPARSGTIIAGLQPFTIQQAGQTCSFKLSSSGITLSYLGIPMTMPKVVTVTPSFDFCTWTAVPSDSWIHIVLGPASGQSPGQFSYYVDSSVTARSGEITVGDQTLAIDQDGIACVFAFPSQSATVSPAGLTIPAQLNFVSNVDICPWTAVSSDPSWIQIVGTGSGQGPGHIRYTVSPSGNIPRKGKISLGGQDFTIYQFEWTWSVSKALISFDYEADASSIHVTTNAPDAPWTATTTDTWVHFPNGPHGIGTQSIDFTVDQNNAVDYVTVGHPNPVPGYRTGVITIAGQQVVIHQKNQKKQITFEGPGDGGGGIPEPM